MVRIMMVVNVRITPHRISSLPPPSMTAPAPMMDNDIPTTESQVKSTEQTMVSRAWALSR